MDTVPEVVVDNANPSPAGWAPIIAVAHGRSRVPDVGVYATIKILREPTTADAPRCALNGWCYWALRNHGQTGAQATKTFERPGFDPVRGTEVTATRRRVLVDRDLPMKDEYRDHVRRLL